MAKRQPAKEPEKIWGYSTKRPGGQSVELDAELGKSLWKVQEVIGKPLWLFCHDGNGQGKLIDGQIREELLGSLVEYAKAGEQIALLIESPGGQPGVAYQLAKAIKRHCGGFDAIVPVFAKSAATLLCLAADKLYVDENAELGPIDMQVRDPEAEEYRSALEHVQSLERLEAYTLRFVSDSVDLLRRQLKRPTKVILPSAVDLVSRVVEPLYANVDVVQYTRMARYLKVMEDYALRLLSDRRDINTETAFRIASELVSRYSDHGFVIDKDETKKLGLAVGDLPERIKSDLAVIRRHILKGFCRLGPIERVEAKNAAQQRQ